MYQNAEKSEERKDWMENIDDCYRYPTDIVIKINIKMQLCNMCISEDISKCQVTSLQNLIMMQGSDLNITYP